MQLRATFTVLSAIALLFVVRVARGDAAPDPDELIRLVQRLSLDLRGTRLSKLERDELKQAARDGKSRSELYVARVDKWLDHAAYRRVMSGYLFFEDHVPLRNSARELRRFVEGGESIYYISGTEAGKPACSASDRVRTRAWWSKRPVAVCRSSYIPEHAFDQVGFCGGRDMRPGCGCGPLLLACLPPSEEYPQLQPRLSNAARDEIAETMAAEAVRDESFDSFMTGQTTWQSGLTEFIYLRRELLGLIMKEPYTPALQRRLEVRLDEIDLDRPARWLERGKRYQGSTPLVDGAIAYWNTYRNGVLALFKHYMCVEFDSVHVDRDALLEVIHGHHEHVRLGPVWQSPMLNQPGCKMCHVPMDRASAFLAGMDNANNGFALTGLEAQGALYLLGPADHRGDGRSLADLTRLVTHQPEFGQCVTRKTFEALLQRPPMNTENRMVAAIAEGFNQHDHRLSWLLRELLKSPSYLGEPSEKTTKLAGSE